MKIPNMLTLLRLVLVPVIILLIYSKDAMMVYISAAVFVIAIITDSLDGIIARKYQKQNSAFGTFMDPLVDKILILSLFFLFVDVEVIPLWIVLLVLFREFLVTGIRQVCSKPKKIVGANWMGKSKFIMQAVNIVHLQIVYAFSLSGIDNILFSKAAAFYFTLFVTLVSLAYAFNFLMWYRKELLSDM